jgi:hypothetical protein
MKIYSLMPFDAFNGSLVEYCPIHVGGFKLVTHSPIQGKRKEKSPRRCELVVTGLTGDCTGLTGVNPVRALRWVTRHL